MLGIMLPGACSTVLGHEIELGVHHGQPKILFGVSARQAGYPQLLIFELGGRSVVHRNSSR